MGGSVAPDDWQGDLNTTYHLGPGLQEVGWTVKLEVHTRNVRTTIYNVVAVMWGSEEPGECCWCMVGVKMEGLFIVQPLLDKVKISFRSSKNFC